MDLIKAKTILSRLQSMHLSLESNATLSALERDLILNYLRELYEIYREADVHILPTLKSVPGIPIANPIDKEPIQKTLEFKFNATEESSVSVPTAVLPPIAEPIVVESADQKHHAEAVVTPMLIEHQTSVIFSSPSVSKNPNLPASILELFEIRKGVELSDKLNELPLRDINRGLGLNDRLEIVNTLFGGQKILFEQIITDLNTFKSFDEAQELLGLGPALQYKWDHEDQRDKAIEFIRLIRRRYL